MNTVPVIDIAPFLAGDVAGRQRVASELARAAEQIGFFAITGHGVPDSIVDALHEQAHAFFDLPLAEKQRMAPLAPTYPRGYQGVGFDALTTGNDPVTPPDLKECWRFGREVIPNIPYFTGTAGRKHFFRNLWPERPAGFARAAYSYYRAMEDVSAALCRISALALGLRENWFADKLDRHITAARINHYPRQEYPPAAGQLRDGPHTDGCMLAILSGEAEPGLQAQTRAGEWVDVATDPHQFVCNVGDLLMRWTNDRWVSGTHRVLNPRREIARTSSCMSIAFFFHPNYDAKIESIPGCAGTALPKYAPVLSGEFRDYDYHVTRPHKMV